MVATPGFFHPATHYKFRMCHFILFWSTLISSAWNMQRDASSADFAAQAQKLEFLEAEVERMFSPCHSDSECANSPGKLWSCKVFIANSKGLILFVQVELYQRGLEECRTYLSTCLESNERLTRWVVLKTFMILSSITVGRRLIYENAHFDHQVACTGRWIVTKCSLIMSMKSWPHFGYPTFLLSPQNWTKISLARPDWCIWITDGESTGKRYWLDMYLDCFLL